MSYPNRSSCSTAAGPFDQHCGESRERSGATRFSSHRYESWARYLKYDFTLSQISFWGTSVRTLTVRRWRCEEPACLKDAMQSSNGCSLRIQTYLMFRLVPKVPSPPWKLPSCLEQRITVYRTQISPSHVTGYKKDHWGLAAPTLLCCILLAGSHTIASTCHSEHLLLHPFDSFAVRAGDVKDVNFILHLVWCTNNIQTWIKTPLSSPELCKANQVIFSRRDS